MREKVVRFGRATSLVGILTEPLPSAAVPGAPAVVLLNSGLLHRVGACRLHVKLARALAARGMATLRFDFSGVGDSDARRDALSFEQAATQEVREAMEFVASVRGANRFLLMGLCSGADMAYATALVDERVLGIVQLDAFAYRTPGYWVRRIAPKLGSWRSWWNVISGRTYLWPAVRRMLGKAPPQAAEEDRVISPYVRAFPPKETVATGLRTLVGRGVRMYNVFSGGQEEHFNHEGQYVAAFRDIDFRGLLRVCHLANADHVFTGREHQQFLVSSTVNWAADFLPAAPGAAASSVAESVAPPVSVPVAATPR